MSDAVITVKVIRVPGAVTEVGLNAGASVQDALNAAGIGLANGETVKLNGADCAMGDCLSDGARVLVAKAAKGA